MDLFKLRFGIPFFFFFWVSEPCKDSRVQAKTKTKTKVESKIKILKCVGTLMVHKVSRDKGFGKVNTMARWQCNVFGRSYFPSSIPLSIRTQVIVFN